MKTKPTEARVAKFARADVATLNSTTPTGITTRMGSNNAEAWPGPFATAYDLLEKRNEAKRLRQEAIENSALGGVVTDCEDELDDYDKILRSLCWNPSSVSKKCEKNSTYVPPLTEICMLYLASNFDHIDTGAINELPIEIKWKLASQLARARKLLPVNATKLAYSGCGVLQLPECSMISEDDLVEVLGYATFMRVLRVGNCGHAFTDTVASIVATRFAAGIEALEIKGLYRISDKALDGLLRSCASSLTELNLSNSFGLDNAVFATIGSMRSLTSLVLDYCTSIRDEHIDTLVTNGVHNVSSLKVVSLVGLTEISDSAIVTVLRNFGKTLTTLRLGGCSQLTDESIMSIRETCRMLEDLDISYLPEVSTAAVLALFVIAPSIPTPSTTETTEGIQDDSDGSSRKRRRNDDWHDTIGKLSEVQMNVCISRAAF
jgi:hypothetical protein